MKRKLVVVPSSEGPEGALYFFAPDGLSDEEVIRKVEASAKVAHDNNGDRSDMVIGSLERKRFKFIGGFSTKGVTDLGVVTTKPWV